ncbi:hypothetical protein GCM10023335_55320 [Streptomyces siamensis]|uniref:Uncharacterized protein n=1 Tax=Streptomyces siamensis TaxID=1274986 RepID=A0ABP9J7A8_9ACTN
MFACEPDSIDLDAPAHLLPSRRGPNPSRRKEAETARLTAEVAEAFEEVYSGIGAATPRSGACR